MWLQPLPGTELIYREISPHIAMRMQKTIEDIDNVLERLKLLADRDICQAFPIMLSLVRQVEESIRYFSQMFKGDLGEFRSQIKRRKRDENTVIDVLEGLEKLPLNVAKMKAWVEVKEKEADLLDEVTCCWKLVQKSKRSVKCRVFLDVHVHSKESDEYIQQLQEATETYAKLERRGSRLQMDIPDVGAWRPPRSALLNEETKRKLLQLQQCYDHHSSNSEIGFEVREKEPSELGQEGTSLGIIDRESRIQMSADSNPDQLLPCPVRNLKVLICSFVHFRLTVYIETCYITYACQNTLPNGLVYSMHNLKHKKS